MLRKLLGKIPALASRLFLNGQNNDFSHANGTSAQILSQLKTVKRAREGISDIIMQTSHSFPQENVKNIITLKNDKLSIFKLKRKRTIITPSESSKNQTLVKIKVTGEMAIQIYKAVDKANMGHLIKKLVNHPLPTKFSTALDLLHIKYESINFNSESGHFLKITQTHLDMLKNIIGKKYEFHELDTVEPVRNNCKQ